MNEKQQQLTFDKGITNVPSDALCSDNTLQDCVGMVYDNGEHKPIQKPEPFMTVDGVKVLYIHTPNSDTENYIVKKGTNLQWGVKDNDQLDLKDEVLLEGLESDDFQIMSIGKTLIVNKSSGVSYFTWKGTGYVQLQSNIPDIDIDFRLVDFKVGDGGEGGDTFNTLNVDDGVVYLDPEGGGQSEYNNIVIGQYSIVRNKAKKDKRFVGPFFVRAALKMYDGSYTKMTAPVLMIPTMMYNAQTNWYWDMGDASRLWLYIYSCALQYRVNNTDYSAYSDLISEITIFVSQEIETINRNADCLLPPPADAVQNMDIVSVYAKSGSNVRARHVENLRFYFELLPSPNKAQWHNFKVLVPRSIQDINADIAETSLFYKLADIGVESTEDWQDASDKIRDFVMENLTTQERLTDEYFGHSVVSGDYAYVYNSRLNLANVRRTIFDGFDKMLSYDWYDSQDIESPRTQLYHIIVTINTNDGAVSVEKEFESTERIGMWFYYPDSRAKRVRIYLGSSLLIVDQTLKEHTGLNGAYYFAGLPVERDYNPEWQPSTPPTVEENPIEELSNSIVTSEVNNPYIFNASGYNQAGEGTVLAVVSNTQALSQGQFGQYPLVIFTTKGIWAMDTDNTGQFVSCKPLSREVCNSAKSVTQTDSAIYFSSDKGLMVLFGAAVKCASEQLNGRNAFDMDFATFLQDAQIAYDYRDSLLWIGHKDAELYWIYSIKSGTFHRYLMSTEEQAARRAETENVIFNFINDYPDSLLQINNQVFSLMKRKNINADTNTYEGYMETRPMKLENALALKSIMQIRHILQFHPYTVDGEEKKGTMTLHIFASNNLDNWAELHSLRGTPWKYYKFRYVFSGLKATDRFAGTMLITQERRTNKLR